MLTKSDLQSFLQCSRKLWLEHKQPGLIPSDATSAYRRTTDGNIVGEKAREQLGPGYLLPRTDENDKNASAKAAKALLAKSPGKPAAEVPMVNGELYARADALIPEGKRYVLQETKASTFPLKSDKISTGDPKEHHLNDVAIQAWVMEGSGLSLGRIELNLLDNKWQYPGNGNYSGLFRQLDVTNEARVRMSDVPEWINAAQAVLSGDMPQKTTGNQCSDPYGCPFLEFCKKRDTSKPAEHPIELLPDSAGKALARKLREEKGYTSILQPKPSELVGKQSELYQRIQAAHKTGKFVLKPGSDTLLKRLAYPRYYFDFEGIDLPVPRWKGVRPYEQIPFQWSCHIERSPGKFTHAEFLLLSGEDPSLACIEHMLKAINPDDGGPIFVYHMTYEKLRLQELGTRHPQHAEVLKKYIDRLFDLLPVVKEHFYDPRMQGSFSIKQVLPVIAPDLDYGKLAEVQDGTAAQVAYLYAAFDSNTTPERKAELDEKMRKYCRQDTWAMVELAYFLSGSPRPSRPTE